MLVKRHGLTWHTAVHLAVLLQRFPILRVSSGRRTRTRNSAVGGVPNSWHLHGRAVDLTGPYSTLVDAMWFARESRVSPGCYGPEEAFVEFPHTRRQHLHVAW
jgi:hypothetical protein